MISTDKIILGTANFGKNYGLLKNKIDEKNKVHFKFCKKKKIKFDTAEEYSNLDIKYDKDLKKFKIFKKLDLNLSFFKTLKSKPYSNLNKILFNNYPCFSLTLRKPNILLKRV